MTGSRAAAHVATVRERIVRSRYDEDATGLGGLADRHGPLTIWTRTLPGATWRPARLLPPTSLRLATDALDLERSAEVLSAALVEDLAVVRRHLGGNLRQVDGTSVLLATRWSDTVVGSVALVLTEDDGGTVAGLHALAVAPTFRGRGIGTALATRAVELGAGAGADLAVATWPRGAPADILERLGFAASAGGGSPGRDRPRPAW